MPADDENDEPQPGDTVIGLRDGVPFIYTQPEKGRSAAPGAQHREENDRQSDTNRFYELLDELDHQADGPRRLRDCTADSGWPAYGVYFFFEDGESRTAGQCPRVVRVGTTTSAPLWHRLATHRGRQASEASTFALAAGPHHAHSVFRRHLGTAIITCDHPGWPPEVLDDWYRCRDQDLSEQIEWEVSQYVGVMPFLWLDVPDLTERRVIEAGAIALMSQRTGAIDRQSPGWLGQHAHKSQIRTSGLWNVQHVNEPCVPRFLDLIDARVQAHR
jgi:hypothetical protein